MPLGAGTHWVIIAQRKNIRNFIFPLQHDTYRYRLF